MKCICYDNRILTCSSVEFSTDGKNVIVEVKATSSDKVDGYVVLPLLELLRIVEEGQMLVGILRDKVGAYAKDVDDLLVEIHQLERRIKYDGEGVEVCDGLDDVKSTLQEAVDRLTDLEIGLNMALEYGVTELEEVADD